MPVARASIGEKNHRDPCAGKGVNSQGATTANHLVIHVWRKHQYTSFVERLDWLRRIIGCIEHHPGAQTVLCVLRQHPAIDRAQHGAKGVS